MRVPLAMVLLLALCPATALAQQGTTKQGVPTPKSTHGPFGSDWAKPLPETGGYIYNDPRLQNNNQPIRPRQRYTCPPGRVINPQTGACL